jgi:hypothetical protein
VLLSNLPGLVVRSNDLERKFRAAFRYVYLAADYGRS